MEDNLKKKKNILIIGILSLLIILMGSTYAFFSYSKGSEAYVLSSSKISAIFTSGTNSITFSNAYPISDQFAVENLDKLTYIDFTVASEVENETQAVEYEIYLTESDTDTLSSDYIKVYLTDENNKEVVAPTIYSSLENSTYDNTGKVIFKDNNPGLHSKNYRLYVWLDQEYSQNEVSQTFSFKVNLYAYNAENQGLNYVLTNAIENHTTDTCNPIVEEDGITYFSGTNDCVNFNYVWYSGKLWRITAIYPDGTMKMITDGAITTINWGSKSTVSSSDLTSAYSTSYIREWLNQEFLPTLNNYENIIVEDAGWYSITDSASTPTKPTGEYTLTDPVGLLNAYEYYMAYKNASTSTNYLNIGYYWWLITPYNSSNVRDVSSNGNLGSRNPSGNGNGARPSVNLQSTIQLIAGSGTATDPYRIKGDLEEAKENVTLINTRQSGEYVKLSSDETAPIFRIVDTELVGENLTTKIVLNDYVKDTNDVDADSDTTEVLTKYFSSSSSYILWTKVDKTNTTYWRGYLNNTWIKEIDNTYNETDGTSSILEKGTYYLGYQALGSYKTSVCSSVSSDVSVRECIENGTVVTNTSSEDYVGLLRVGEMFASQFGTGNSSLSNMWLINPYYNSGINGVRYIESTGYLSDRNPSSNSLGVRPSINLKSTILIKSGSGTKADPFVVGLPSSE